MNTLKTWAVPLLVTLLIAASFAVMGGQSPTLAETRDSAEPTMATCRAWIRDNHSLNYENHGCEDHADVLASVAAQGGGVIPVGDNRFSIVWFPDDWEQRSDRALVVTLHGSGGCAEPNYQWWTERTVGHQYAVLSLQYAQEDLTGGDLLFDSGAEIYENLRTALGELRAHCPLSDTALALHGFSRGSARAIEIALMDRAPDGMKAFASFIADSGTGFAESGGAIPPYLENAPPGAYSGAHFWLYCGELDHGGQTCTDMDRLAPIIRGLDGTVDALYKNPTGGHGIFITEPGESPTGAQLALFDYIDSLSPPQATPSPRLYLPLIVKTTAQLSVTPPGGTMITYVPSDSGDIAVQVSLPETPRYPDGAGVVVEVATFLTSSGDFYTSLDVTELGLIQVAYLWPGTTSSSTGAHSDGTYDYGGEEGTKGLRDVLRYVTGQIPDRDGFYLAERLAITPLTDQVGLYAFSHPGIAAVSVLAFYGDQVPGVSYLVGRENPTVDTITAVEVGYFDDTGQPVLNPLYHYPDDYGPTTISLDYSSIRWDADYLDEARGYSGRPYFDINGNTVLDEGDHALGPRVPTMYGKRFYSAALTQALLDNGALSEADWPAELATPAEAAALWSYRSSVQRYPDLATRTPNLKVMLVFAMHDHVQPAADKPHIHQAYEGFRHGAGLWTRLNPDQAYVAALSAELGDLVPEHPANTEPADWLTIESWGYPKRARANVLVPLAAVAEMADRVHENRWDADLDQVLVTYSQQAGG